MSLFNLLAETPDNTMSYIILGVLIVVCIALVFVTKSQRKKQQEEAEKKIQSLAVGDKIKTIGMICGEVVEICEDGSLVLLTGSDNYPSYIRIDQRAIYEIFKSENNNANEEVFSELSENATAETETATEATTETATEATTETTTETKVEATEKADDDSTITKSEVTSKETTEK